jgi:ribonuclease HI
LVRKGVLLGTGKTNNEAESTACLKALEMLEALQKEGQPNLKAPIRILGDSQLIIRMLLGVFHRSKKPSLYLTMDAI